jgi:hypothetical protein
MHSLCLSLSLSLSLSIDIEKLSMRFKQEITMFPNFSIQHTSDLLWGTYRPHLYFGMRTRTGRDALVNGLLWYRWASTQDISTFACTHTHIKHNQSTFFHCLYLSLLVLYWKIDLNFVKRNSLYCWERRSSTLLVATTQWSRLWDTTLKRHPQQSRTHYNIY